MEELRNLAKAMTDVTERLTGLTETVNDFEGRLESVLGDISQTAVQNVKEHFQPQLDTIHMQVDSLTNRVTTLETDIDNRLSNLEQEVASIKGSLPVKEAFDPKISVIIFGMVEEEDEYLPAVVDLFKEALQANVNVIDLARTSPRDGRPGAIKVELSSTYKKLHILRLKRKCADIKKYEKVRIRGCEDHSDWVNRLNSTYLLKLLGKDKDHVVVGNGVIRSKAEIAEFHKKNKENEAAATDEVEEGAPKLGRMPAH